MRPELLLCFAALFVSACAPCEYDNGIVSGEVTDGATGDPLDGGLVELAPTATGELIEAGVFGEGLFEASVPAGDYQVTGWDADHDCFSAIATITVEPCDERTVDLVIIDCF